MYLSRFCGVVVKGLSGLPERAGHEEHLVRRFAVSKQFGKGRSGLYLRDTLFLFFKAPKGAEGFRLLLGFSTGPWTLCCAVTALHRGVLPRLYPNTRHNKKHLKKKEKKLCKTSAAVPSFPSLSWLVGPFVGPAATALNGRQRLARGVTVALV